MTNENIVNFFGKKFFKHFIRRINAFNIKLFKLFIDIIAVYFMSNFYAFKFAQIIS